MFGGGRAVVDQESGTKTTLRLLTGLCTMLNKQQKPVLAVREFI